MRDVPGLDGLELLTAALRHGSISAAARECGVSQQSASARLRAIERALGLELLQRSPRGVAPTLAGETVASWADDVLAAAERFRIGVETLRGEHRRRLTVAASQTVAAHLIPGWLVALRDRQLRSGGEATAVRLITANSAEVERLVRAGAAELGVIESSALPSGLSSSRIGEDVLALVVAPGHPWAARAGAAMAEAADAALVVREEGSGTRRAWEDAVRARLGREPTAPAAVLPTTAAVRSAVAEGVGPAVLSRLAVADDVGLGRLAEVPLDGEELRRPITALWRGGPGDLPLAGRELLEVAVAAHRR